jgi:hypothetical protein
VSKQKLGNTSKVRAYIKEGSVASEHGKDVGAFEMSENMGKMRFEMNANNSVDYNVFSNTSKQQLFKHSFSGLSYDEGNRSMRNMDMSTLSILNEQRHVPTIFAN